MSIFFGDDDELMEEVDDEESEDFACIDCANGICDYHLTGWDEEDERYFNGM